MCSCKLSLAAGPTRLDLHRPSASSFILEAYSWWRTIDSFVENLLIFLTLVKTHPKRIKPSSQTPPKTPPPLSPTEKSRFLAQHLYRNATSLLRDKTLRSGSMALALTVKCINSLVVGGKNMGRYEFTNLLVYKPTKQQQKTINKETGWLLLLGEKNFMFHKPELRLLWKDSSKLLCVRSCEGEFTPTNSGIWQRNGCSFVHIFYKIWSTCWWFQKVMRVRFAIARLTCNICSIFGFAMRHVPCPSSSLSHLVIISYLHGINNHWN